MNQTVPCFAVSPDGIVCEGPVSTRLLEIKCKVNDANLDGDDLLDTLDYLRRDVTTGEWSVKENHAYYGQIQFGLCLCDLKEADLVIYWEYENAEAKVEEKIFIVPVEVSPNFVLSMMRILFNVYFDYVLPFLCAHSDILEKKLYS